MDDAALIGGQRLAERIKRARVDIAGSAKWICAAAQKPCLECLVAREKGMR